MQRSQTEVGVVDQRKLDVKVERQGNFVKVNVMVVDDDLSAGGVLASDC